MVTPSDPALGVPVLVADAVGADGELEEGPDGVALEELGDAEPVSGLLASCADCWPHPHSTARVTAASARSRCRRALRRTVIAPVYSLRALLGSRRAPRLPVIMGVLHRPRREDCRTPMISGGRPVTTGSP
jgi:hypothetical protein